MVVVALIGDIVGSRKIKQRGAFQTRFRHALDGVNQYYSAAHRQGRLLSPYTITLGDEIQAVYGDAVDLFGDMWSIAANIFPQRIRFSIAVGPLTTPINPERAIGMDGPAFHLAREGIEQLRRRKELLAITGDPAIDMQLENDAARLIAHSSDRWKATRWRVAQRLARDEGAVAIGEAVGLTTGAVYKNIRAGALDVIVGLGFHIGRSLNGKAASL